MRFLSRLSLLLLCNQIPPADQLPADLEGALYRFDGDRVFMNEMCKEFRIICLIVCKS
ncbi:hypothetical protein [Candidatus Villigracilis saccharophilus]|uniref:hypothetical protein n=1 Tax=Candidatus Villigracilis saccharophilus TaxID=3140684 RepID=UPI003134728F|nr:hypothetical protein [Anaerolineales bacterium]